jgi:hypothetical protein
MNTYLIDSRLKKISKIKTMNFDNLKITTIYNIFNLAPNKVLKQQNLHKKFFPLWEQLTFMTIDKHGCHQMKN